jgi:glycosyltransferase involved in cell wall biosynthesis
MVIAATLLAHNEADVIGQTIEHHLTHGVDRFVVTDNDSSDDTARIARSFKRVAEVVYQPGDGHCQGEWVTRMARHPACLGADWVVHLDCDEFWYATDSLASVPADVGVVRIPLIHDHPPVHGLGPGLDRLDMPNYQARRHPGRVAHRPSVGAVIADGNHSVSGVPGRLLDDFAGIDIHHYPVRGFAQFEAKVRRCERVLVNMPEGSATHWRRLVDLLRRGELRREYDAFVARGWLYDSL